MVLVARGEMLDVDDAPVVDQLVEHGLHWRLIEQGHDAMVGGG